MQKSKFLKVSTVIFLLLAVSMIIKTQTVYASGTFNGYQYTVSGNEAAIIGYNGTGGNIIIPETITEGENVYTVTSIGNYAFYNCTTLTSVTIPNTVKNIGCNVFYNCKALTSINIPDGVTSIGSDAFYNCKALTSINIPNGVTSIGMSAFGNCSKLTNVIIPNTVTSIGESAFAKCSALTSISIPDGVTSISNGTFQGCIALSNIEIPNSVTNIGKSAFSSCGLTNIIIPEGVKTIGDNAFYYSALTNITLPSTLISIGDQAFNFCKFLTKVSIPDGVTSIGDSVFAGCTKLTNVSMPNSITSIGVYAFFVCKSLTSINISDNITNIRQGAFSDCISLTSVTIPENVTSIGESAFSNCSWLTSVTIPKNVISIGESAFNNCESLKSITIPENVTSIDKEAFLECKNLERIEVSNENKVYSSVDGVLYNKDKTTLIFCPNAKASSFTVPNYVISIDEYAFRNCSNLTSINIPESVTSIGKYAFSNCKNLKNINIPKGVTSIAAGTFSCCGFESFIVPKNIQVIGERAFYDCERLKNIEILNGTKSIGEFAFCNCENIRNLNIPEGVTDIGKSAFANCSLYENIKLPDTLRSIGDGAFAACDMKTIVIPGSVTNIGSYAFTKCTKLTSVKFLGNAPTINSRAFADINSSLCNSNLKIYYIKGNTGFNDYRVIYGWTIDTFEVHKVIFKDMNEDGDMSMTVYSCDEFRFPEIPVRKGYEFDGWYDEPEFINEYDFSEHKIVKDTTIYTKWLVESETLNVQRIAGKNRIETSIMIAKELYSDNKPDAIVLATANNFADALSGSGLAYKYNAPLLLTNKTVKNSKNVLDYITNNLSKGKNIYILGGTGVVSKEISDYLAQRGYIIIRLGGNDRYETNQKIVDYLNIPKGKSIVIATGTSFADALSISSIADINGYPILLNTKHNLLSNVSKYISDIQPETIYIIGGCGVLSADIEEQIKNINSNIDIVRLGGVNRYDTSLKIFEYFNPDTKTAAVATGMDFPDALSGSVLAARKNTCILLTDNNWIGRPKSIFDEKGIRNFIVFGGEAVVNSDVINILKSKAWFKNRYNYEYYLKKYNYSRIY